MTAPLKVAVGQLLLDCCDQKSQVRIRLKNLSSSLAPKRTWILKFIYPYKIAVLSSELHSYISIMILNTLIYAEPNFFQSSRKKPLETHHLVRLIIPSSSFQKHNFPLLICLTTAQKCNCVTFLFLVIHQSINLIYSIYSKSHNG